MLQAQYLLDQRPLYRTMFRKEKVYGLETKRQKQAWLYLPLLLMAHWRTLFPITSALESEELEVLTLKVGTLSPRDIARIPLYYKLWL